MTHPGPAIIGAALFGAATIAFPVTAAAQTILSITIPVQNTNPVRPTAPINNLQELSQAFAHCWAPPPVDTSRLRRPAKPVRPGAAAA